MRNINQLSIVKLFTVAVLAIATLAFSQSTASAQAATPSESEVAGQIAFACDPGFYQVISGQLAEFNPGTGYYQNIGVDHSNYNAVGYRLADGLLYGVQGSNLIRIDATGTVTTLGSLDLSKGGSYTGDFGDDGLLHISRGGRDWHAVDVDTLEVTSIPELDAYSAVADIANVHGKFYGVASNGDLYSYDPTQGVRKNLGRVDGLPTSLKAYGAAWATAGGNLYIGRNSGEIYQITGYTTQNPFATQVGSATSTNSNDGSSCSIAVVPAGLNDVDGPVSESEPQTPEAIEAAETYVENFETVAETFEEFEVPEPVVTPEEPTTPAVEVGTEVNTPIDDAGLGTGATCDGISEDMNPRDAVEVTHSVDTASVIYADTFDNTSPSEFEILSGVWSISDSTLRQTDDCGYDLAAVLPEIVVSDFIWEASVIDLAGLNNGGLLIHQSTAHTRSGAVLVDLTDGGTTLRWGQYDNLGYYSEIGSMENPGFTPGATQNISVEVHGTQVDISLNGEAVANFTAIHDKGIVGLVASASAVSFDDVTLTALSAN